MSRHRNVRSMNYEDEYYDEDEAYGHSFDDNYCISPGTAAQFTFNRDRGMELSTFMEHEEGIPEEDEEQAEEEVSPRDEHRGSLDYTRPQLSDIQEANLNSCLEEIRSILGESVPEHIMVDTVIKHNFSLETALNDLLLQQEAPKPQREPRGRRNRSQAKATEDVEPTVVTQTPSIAVPKVTGPTVILQKPKPKISVTESAESLSQVTVSEKLQNQLNDRTRDVTQSVTSKNNIGVSKNSKNDIKTPQKSKPASKNSQDIVDSRDAIDKIFSVGRVLDSGAGEGNIQKDQIAAPATVVAQSAVNNGGEKELSTPKKERYIPPLPRSASKSKNDKRDLIAEYKKREGEKDMMNLVVIGHVDAGKSTLMGHLLYQLGNVNKRLMHKYEQESKKVGKSSFAYAWVLDETEEERVRGVTMDIAQTRFETQHKIITLLDAPGHKDFIPNMITGTAQADVAILVVNATKGEFETGFESGGQTREHALLARSLGVSQLIVAVNKMDTVGWEQTRYDEVVRKLGQFMKQAGFKDTDTSFIPVSGLSGENLVKPISEPKLSDWYKGSTLVEQIDKFRSVSRPIDKPLRICVSDVFKGMGSGFSVTGKIASGCVQIGDRVIVMPASEYAMVKGISINDEAVNYAFAGDHVSVVITGIDMAHVPIGSMICDIQEPVLSATRIRARIVLFNLEIPMTRGFTVVFHFQSITEPAVVKKLVSHLNKTTGEVIKNKPKCLTKNSSAVVEIEFVRPVCLELYKDNKELGRFMLRSGGHTIAAGVTEEVLKTKTGTFVESQGASAN